MKKEVRRRLQLILRGFQSRNYCLYFAGQGVSLIGSWMQNLAMSWLVYRLTHSAMLLGVTGFLSQAPTLLVAPFAGVIIDRSNKRTIVIAMQVIAMLQALALALLVFSHAVAVWHILALSVVVGLVNAFDVPARQSFIVEMVEQRDHLSNVIALNSVMFNSARLIGPAIAGVLIAVAGEGVCFLINSFSFGAAIAALLLMALPRSATASAHRHFLHELREGFSTAFGCAPIRALLLLTGWVSLVALPYGVLLPVFAREVLRGDSQTLGFLTAAVGCGALVGALYLASRTSVAGLGSLVAVATGLFGAGLTGFALSRHFVVSLALMLVIGFGVLVQLASTNTLLQTLVADDKRGRVMSIYTMSFMGVVPLGCLLTGWCAQRIGAPRTQLIGGVACMAAALVFALRLPGFAHLLRPAAGHVAEQPLVAQPNA